VTNLDEHHRVGSREGGVKTLRSPIAVKNPTSASPPTLQGLNLTVFRKMTSLSTGGACDSQHSMKDIQNLLGQEEAVL